MKIFVFGQRKLEDLDFVYQALDSYRSGLPAPITEVVAAGTDGAPALAASWAISRKLPCRFLGEVVAPFAKKQQPLVTGEKAVAVFLKSGTVQYFDVAFEFLDKKTETGKLGIHLSTQDAYHSIPLPEQIQTETAARQAFFRALDPGRDGTDFINIYSRGQTELGRLLSNFTPRPEGGTIATADGAFLTVEGYWYWLRSAGLKQPKDSIERERLRKLAGFEAKAAGRLLMDQLTTPKPQDLGEFRMKIKDAILSKINSSKTIMKMFFANEKPFTHYYVYGTPPRVISGEGQWIIDFLNKTRCEL